MRRVSILSVTAALLTISCGILTPRPDTTRWFVLATIEELDPERTGVERTGHSLGIGPPALPRLRAAPGDRLP